eukprot:4213968-Lingulodinium_polyedra.AAC.1
MFGGQPVDCPPHLPASPPGIMPKHRHRWLARGPPPRRHLLAEGHQALCPTLAQCRHCLAERRH